LLQLAEQRRQGRTSNYTVTGSLAANTTPGSTEMSSDDLIALFESGVDFLAKLDDGVSITGREQASFLLTTKPQTLVML
jgi:hypothetical protein